MPGTRGIFRSPTDPQTGSRSVSIQPPVRHFTPRATAATHRKVGFVTARDPCGTHTEVLAKNPRDSRIDDSRARPYARPIAKTGWISRG